MIDKLIKEGRDIESKAEEGLVQKFFSCVEFEKWTAKSMIYLERNYNGFSITDKAKEKYQSINTNTNYEFYLFLLGTLEATKEFEMEDNDNYNYSL